MSNFDDFSQLDWGFAGMVQRSVRLTRKVIAEVPTSFVGSAARTAIFTASLTATGVGLANSSNLSSLAPQWGTSTVTYSPRIVREAFVDEGPMWTPSSAHTYKARLKERFASMAEQLNYVVEEGDVQPEALKAARKLMPQLPNTLRQVKISVDGDGNVVFNLTGSITRAYLTVTPTELHVLRYGENGKNNEYIDSFPSDGRRLSGSVWKAIYSI